MTWNRADTANRRVCVCVYKIYCIRVDEGNVIVVFIFGEINSKSNTLICVIICAVGVADVVVRYCHIMETK